MIKSSALYIVIIFALVIGVICSSLIVTGYFYRLQYQKANRRSQLNNNLASATNIILASDDTSYANQKSFSLYNLENDSVSTQRIFWGLYDIGIAKAFIQHDTLYNIFSIANLIDSTKWAALYFSDNNGSLGISGNSMIRGNIFIPAGGVKPAYVDGKFYNGDKRIVIGNKNQSSPTLPILADGRLHHLIALYQSQLGAEDYTTKNDSIVNSFNNQTQFINLGKKIAIFQKLYFKGNIIIHSDTTITIDSTTRMDNVMVFAKSIIIRDGFRGKAQFFAQDSLSVGKNCQLNYPSCLGILRKKSPLVKKNAFLKIGPNAKISGAVIFFEEKDYQESISANLATIGKNSIINGQIYSNDQILFQDSVRVNGSIFATRFLYQSSYSAYTNYLVNIKIDERSLSRYYLTSTLFPVAKNKERVLEWLESN
ncbi:hypothetical protein SAMN05216490_4772 [Mucilaginibacter mallensis]|uniref:Uncharacterized protein n=1 Tax=Mucilaginibacter mallensis TaxID=652787 RepID=A0A1H2CAE9_MUCMA|nr:hypothetical protein [Mucilaginibacter mallensis]SDT67227.1 hypothetical protein SAMN05216490_4772 [Mucilaginibacter mallensis]